MCEEAGYRLALTLTLIKLCEVKYLTCTPVNDVIIFTSSHVYHIRKGLHSNEYNVNESQTHVQKKKFVHKVFSGVCELLKWVWPPVGSGRGLSQEVGVVTSWLSPVAWCSRCRRL